ncbi:integrase [Variovorax sp. GrIS 2.14]|uniref:tyrosine-type recombinase/integrase n=1 Tax=Variovorax sp. GrIS 2.14 TaxID=3071709 RepID=UPI0038F6F015
MKQRDRLSQMGLLPRMEARPLKNGGASYRYHPVEGKPIALGHDKEAALRKVLDLTGVRTGEGDFPRLWRLYQDTARWKKLADSTKTQYRDNWNELEKVFAKGYVALTRPKAIAYYLRIHRADAPVVANREVALLSNLFKLAVELGEVDRNPCKEVERNPEVPRDRLVEHEEFIPFVAWALQQGPSATVLVSMAQFSALAGNRRAEFRDLHWPQANDEVVRLTRAKQRGNKTKREVIGVSVALKVVLDRMRAMKDYSPMGAVFRSPKTNNAYSESGFKTMWARLMRKAREQGIVKEHFTFHDLRGHYTTYYKEQFGELPELHADPKTTAGIYERSKSVSRRAL